MSYDTILNGLHTGGTAIGDTMLGRSPEFDPRIPGANPITQFTGDTLRGIGDPKGLLGQALRVIGTIAAFHHSPQAGLALLGAFKEGDKQQSSDLGLASAMQQTPTQYEQQYGQPIPRGTPLTGKDVPDIGNTGLPLPSQTEPVLNFPTSPEDMVRAMQAQKAQMMLEAGKPNFAAGMNQEQLVQEANRRAASGLPSFPRGNEAVVTGQMQSMAKDVGGMHQHLELTGKGPIMSYSSEPHQGEYMSRQNFDKIQTPAPEIVKQWVDDENNPGFGRAMFFHVPKESSGGEIRTIDQSAIASANKVATPYSDEWWKEVENRRNQLAKPPKSPAETSVEGMFQDFQKTLPSQMTATQAARFKSALMAASSREDPTMTVFRAAAEQKGQHIPSAEENFVNVQKQITEEMLGPGSEKAPTSPQELEGILKDLRQPETTPTPQEQRATPQAIETPQPRPATQQPRQVKKANANDLGTSFDPVLVATKNELATRGPIAAASYLAKAMNLFSLSKSDKISLLTMAAQKLPPDVLQAAKDQLQ